MKKIKKVLAMIMAMAMIMGLGMTAFAAPDDDSTTSNIIVNGLAAEDEVTTVNLYPAITWDEAGSNWVVATWADPYIDIEGDAYVITDKEALVAAVTGSPITQQLAANSTTVTFENVPVGAYVVTASGTNASYAPMVAENYKDDATYMEAEDITIVAKTDGYVLTKEQKVEAAGDKFVGRGEEVTFTITTTFPSFDDPDAEDNSYKIVDTPNGLEITEVNSILIGGDDATVQGSFDQESGEYTIDLTSEIGTTNANAGKSVVIEYTAIVTSEEGYSNTANAFRNDVALDEDGDGDEGFTGDITITKYAEDGSTVLNGAEFEVYHGTKAEAEEDSVEALEFVMISEGVYKLALNGEEDATTTVVATNGTVQVKGLEEGNYWFKEVKAPEGYSINEDGVPVTIIADDTKDVSMVGSLTDSKLSSLPSTGGMGTTIFTIGGIVIMVAAAGLYFANRRKNNAE